MDNLQFRAWDAFWESMVTPKELKSLIFKKGTISDVETEEGISSTHHYIFMQATGFFDRQNERSIFESDIVEVRTIGGELYSVGIVRKTKGVFYLEHPITKEIVMMSDFYFKSYTSNLEMVVIGNIYENSDVMKDYIKEELKHGE